MAESGWRAWSSLPADWAARKEVLVTRDPYSDQVVSIIDRLDGVTRAYTLDDPTAVAMWTPGRRLLLGGMGAEAAVKLAHFLADEPLIGVAGYQPEVEAFREAAERLRGILASAAHHLIFHELGALVPPRPCAGRSRRATLNDTALLLDWHLAFGAEADPSAPKRTEDQVRMAIAQRALWIWETEADGPVSFAGLWWAGATGSRIGPVYTPPEQRGRGYASALVHACADHGGRVGRCTLFTNADNPTSNAIYRALGFEPGRRFQEWDFPAG